MGEKVYDILIKEGGRIEQLTMDELQALEDRINDIQGEFLHDFGDSRTLEAFAIKRRYGDRLAAFAKAKTLMDFFYANEEEDE